MSQNWGAKEAGSGLIRDRRNLRSGYPMQCFFATSLPSLNAGAAGAGVTLNPEEAR